MKIKLYKFLGVLFLFITPVKAAQLFNDSGKQLISLDVISQLSDKEERVKVDIDERSTVHSLKELLAYQIGFMLDFHMLYAKQGPLDQEQATLLSCGLQDGTLLYAAKTSKGPASFKDLKFADGTNYKDSKLETATKDTPVWNIVDKGFSYVGICRNKDCKANGKRVYIYRGNNKTFNIPAEIVNKKICICPGCKKYIRDIVTWGVNECNYVIKGMILDTANSSDAEKNYKEYEKKGSVDKWRCFFEDKEGKGVSEFASLEITVSDLK